MACSKKLADLKPPKPRGAPRSAVQTFDRVKAIYIFSLVGFHQQMLAARAHSVYMSDHLPYETMDHGVEIMMGLFLISGWLSSMTWKQLSWKDHMRKKVGRLMPPYIVATVLTIIPVILNDSDWSDVAQYILECLTLGGWNPTLMWTSSNRPLWFISTLLSYHYISPFFLPWIRRRSVKQLVAIWIVFLLVRLGIAAGTLFVLRHMYTDVGPYTRVIHLWSPIQVWLPAMGAICQQLGDRVEIPSWLSRRVARVLTDTLIFVVFGLTTCIPSTRSILLDALISYTNLIIWPFITAAVMLMSCDSNSIWAFANVSVDMQALFGTMLKLSYTLYLTHWPLALVLQHAGLFVTDSWDTVVGMVAVSIIFAGVLEAFVVGLFARFFNGWLDAVGARRSEQTPQGKPTDDSALAGVAPIGMPAGDSALAGEAPIGKPAGDSAPTSQSMRPSVVSASAPSTRQSILRRSVSSVSAPASLLLVPEQHGFVDRILQLERNLHNTLYGTTAMDAVDAGEIDDEGVRCTIAEMTGSVPAE